MRKVTFDEAVIGVFLPNIDGTACLPPLTSFLILWIGGNDLNKPSAHDDPVEELICFMETVATCWKAWFHLSAIYLPQLMSHMCMRHISLSIYNGRVTVLATVLCWVPVVTFLCFTLLFNSKTSLPFVWCSPTQRQGHATFVPQSSRGHTPAFIYTNYWMTLSFQNTCLGFFDLPPLI